MRGGAIILVIIGVLVILAGAGMDTTKTSTSCYEYQSDFGNSGGCVEYTYSDPAPKAITMLIGFGLVVGGAVYNSQDSTTTANRSTTPSSEENSQDSSDESFAEKLRERSN